MQFMCSGSLQLNHSSANVEKSEKFTVTASLADDKASFQMVLPMSEMLFDVAGAIEQTASELGLRMMKALIDEEVEQITGNRYSHRPDRRAIRWGKGDGHVIFAGRKVAMGKPRVRSKDGTEEVPLCRWDAFAHPRRMEQGCSEQDITAGIM